MSEYQPLEEKLCERCNALCCRYVPFTNLSQKDLDILAQVNEVEVLDDSLDFNFALGALKEQNIDFAQAGKIIVYPSHQGRYTGVLWGSCGYLNGKKCVRMQAGEDVPQGCIYLEIGGDYCNMVRAKYPSEINT